MSPPSRLPQRVPPTQCNVRPYIPAGYRRHSPNSVSSLTEGGFSEADRLLSDELAEIDAGGDSYVLADLHVPITSRVLRVRPGDSSDSDLEAIDPNVVFPPTSGGNSSSATAAGEHASGDAGRPVTCGGASRHAVGEASHGDGVGVRLVGSPLVAVPPGGPQALLPEPPRSHRRNRRTFTMRQQTSTPTAEVGTDPRSATPPPVYYTQECQGRVFLLSLWRA